VPVFLVFAACAFASGFALRLADPIVLPVAAHFAVSPTSAAMLNTAYALPYALAQPFLGPIGDRFGKPRCIQVCVAGLAAMLLLGALAQSFAVLLATRVAAGVFAGGLIPLVLAGIGDSFDMRERQVMIGRMLFAIISGQLLGSVVSGFANDAFGWHSALAIGAAIGALATAIAWGAMPRGTVASASRDEGTFADLYARVLVNPKAPWLIGGVAVEGAFFYGLFPQMGELLLATTAPGDGAIARTTGIVLGAFGVGGLVYAAGVRVFLRAFGVRRMCLIGAVGAAAAYAALAFVPSWWAAALAMFVAGVSFYMLHNSMQTEATELAPSARGSAVALFACGFFVGQGLGPPVFAALLHALGPRGALFAVAIVIVVLGRTVVAQVIDRRAVVAVPSRAPR
jgi:MFS family permease